jgi:hypothetical protein
VPKEDSGTILESEPVVDALRCYHELNGQKSYCLAPAGPFLKAAQPCILAENARLTFYDDALKLRLQKNGRDYAVDYHYEEPDNAFILFRQNEKLIIKDCKLPVIADTMEQL